MARTESIGELSKVSLRERVSSALRAAIISGEMEPGVVYSAPSLGTRFGVSATPVREAMLDLMREGLVTIAPNKGFRVTEVDDAYMDHITEIRLLIEPPTCAKVTPLIPAKDLPRLRRLARNIIDWAEKGNLESYTKADSAFHLAILSYDENPRLLDLVADLRSKTRLVGLAKLVDRGELAGTAYEHLTIVDLIEAGNPADVEKFVHSHISQVRTTWAGPQRGMQRRSRDAG